ncbi:MAG: hypothetical protein WBA93_00120, partial [Microcoleaceae cyanobacterium]
MRLSPVLVAIFAASTTFGFSKSANAQTSEATINADFIPISVNSTTQFAKLSLTKSFLDAVAHGGNPQDRAASLVEFGSSFPVQKFSEGTNDWSEKPVKLDFYTLLNFKEIKAGVILTKSIDSKNIFLSNKQIEKKLALEVSGETEIPQLTLLDKTVETNREVLANKQFASVNNIPENVSGEAEKSELFVLAKGGETKPEVLAQKQFASVNNIPENIVPATENSPAVVLAKGAETKREVLANKQFASVNNIQENIVPATENSPAVVLAKGGETKREVLANKQFASVNNIQENIAPATENSPAVVLAKGGETKPEVLANKQFVSGINTELDSLTETGNSSIVVLAKKGETKPE